MKRTIWIESETFHGNAILNSELPPYGYGLEHVRDCNTNDVYTVIIKGDKNYAYLEREDGSLVYNG